VERRRGGRPLARWCRGWRAGVLRGPLGPGTLRPALRQPPASRRTQRRRRRQRARRPPGPLGRLPAAERRRRDRPSYGREDVVHRRRLRPRESRRILRRRALANAGAFAAPAAESPLMHLVRGSSAPRGRAGPGDCRSWGSGGLRLRFRCSA
jgi:hypothetical protein